MNVVNLCWRLAFLLNDYKTLTKESVVLVCYIGPNTRKQSLTQVHTKVHRCHCLPKEWPNKGFQTYQRIESPFGHGDILFFAPEPKIGS